MFVHNMNILRLFLVNHRHFFTVRLEWLHLVWNNQCKCSCVGRNIFSEICLYLDINNRWFEFFFLLGDIECEKWVKCLIIARSYVRFGYQFIHTKAFNSKQSCITIHPRQFLVGERITRKHSRKIVPDGTEDTSSSNNVFLFVSSFCYQHFYNCNIIILYLCLSINFCLSNSSQTDTNSFHTPVFPAALLAIVYLIFLRSQQGLMVKWSWKLKVLNRSCIQILFVPNWF